MTVLVKEPGFVEAWYTSTESKNHVSKPTLNTWVLDYYLNRKQNVHLCIEKKKGNGTFSQAHVIVMMSHCMVNLNVTEESYDQMSVNEAFLFLF